MAAKYNSTEVWNLIKTCKVEFIPVYATRTKNNPVQNRNMTKSNQTEKNEQDQKQPYLTKPVVCINWNPTSVVFLS